MNPPVNSPYNKDWQKADPVKQQVRRHALPKESLDSYISNTRCSTIFSQKRLMSEWSIISIFSRYFVQTLVAVVTGLLGQKDIFQMGSYTRVLLTFVFASASVISLAWALKLWALHGVIQSQNSALIDMEDAALPFPMIGQSWWYLKNQRDGTPKITRKFVCVFNYYILPLALLVVFAILALDTSGVISLNIAPLLVNNSSKLTTHPAILL